MVDPKKVSSVSEKPGNERSIKKNLGTITFARLSVREGREEEREEKKGRGGEGGKGNVGKGRKGRTLIYSFGFEYDKILSRGGKGGDGRKLRKG